MPQDGNKEIREECLEQVQYVFGELKVKIFHTVTDRAHRIGKAIKINGKNEQQMIVLLTTWRHRNIIHDCGRYAKLDSNNYLSHFLFYTKYTWTKYINI